MKVNIKIKLKNNQIKILIITLIYFKKKKKTYENSQYNTDKTFKILFILP